MRIVKNDDTVEFEKYFRSFSQQNVIFNPIYDSKFAPYYISAARDREFKNFSFLVISDEIPLVLCALTLNGDSHLDYFGNPGLIYLSSTVSKEELNQGVNMLYSYLNNSQLLSILKLSFSINIFYDDIELPKSFEKFLNVSDSSNLLYSRIIDLKKPLQTLLSDFSKSAKQVLKKHIDSNFKIFTIDSRNYNVLDLNSNFIDFRNLHFISAGRQTRSEESWLVQKRLIENGDAFLCCVKLNKQLLASSLFYTSGENAYYASSAFDKSAELGSLNHLTIIEAFRYLKELGFGYLHFGNQFSKFTNNLENKILNIEKFKSFFGGNLYISSLIVKN